VATLAPAAPRKAALLSGPGYKPDTITHRPSAPTTLRACLSRVFPYCVNRLAGTFPTQERDLLVFKGIGGFEKLFEFVDRSRRQMSDVLQVSFEGSPIRKRKDPVITFTFPLAGLQDAKHAYRFASKHKAWVRRGVMYDKHVERVAIFSFGGWHEPPIVWVGQTGEQRFRQREDFKLGVKFEFAPAAARGLYNGVNVFLIGPGGEPREVCHVRLASGRREAPQHLPSQTAYSIVHSNISPPSSAQGPTTLLSRLRLGIPALALISQGEKLTGVPHRFDRLDRLTIWAEILVAKFDRPFHGCAVRPGSSGVPRCLFHARWHLRD
jgi:hypothetical protein